MGESTHAMTLARYLASGVTAVLDVGGPFWTFVKLLKERDVVYVTTLAVNEGYREVFEQRFKPTDLERRLGDAEVRPPWTISQT